MRSRNRLPLALSCAALAMLLGACEDPARPVPDVGGSAVFVDSDPRGASIVIDGDATGEVTPALIDELEEGARSVLLELDTVGFTYTAGALVVVSGQLEPSVLLPLTVRCSSAQCLRRNAEFHAPQNTRFVINAAGPLFAYEGLDQGIVWPTSTPNSYAALGAATITALVGAQPVALGLRNAGSQPNWWAGRPVPEVTGADPYRVRVPAWITPPASTNASQMRGLEIVQEVIVDESIPDVIRLRITWRNISADSLYRSLDPGVPPNGITFTDVWLGFILDADVGAFAESDDDLVSYSAQRGLVYAYDSDFAVFGFSGGWSDRPALVGLALLDGPGVSVRLNAWPRSNDFTTGLNDDAGRALVTAGQTQPANHPDARIGFAPDTEDGDYLLSAATGPLTLAPGDSATANFAVLLAAPAAGTFVSGQLQPAGDPSDDGRPLAAVAAPLLDLADAVIGTPAP